MWEKFESLVNQHLQATVRPPDHIGRHPKTLNPKHYRKNLAWSCGQDVGRRLDVERVDVELEVLQAVGHAVEPLLQAQTAPVASSRHQQPTLQPLQYRDHSRQGKSIETCGFLL